MPVSCHHTMASTVVQNRDSITSNHENKNKLPADLVNRARASAAAGSRSFRYRKKSEKKPPPKFVVRDADIAGHLILTAYAVGISGSAPREMIQSQKVNRRNFKKNRFFAVLRDSVLSE